MRKITATLLAMFLTVMVADFYPLTAQTLFHEGFDDGELPAGWTVEHTGDYQGWISKIIDQDSIISNGVMADENVYWFYSSYTPDNWLISPSISLPASSKLTFRVRGGVANPENFSVYVATSHLVEDMLNGTPVLTGQAYLNTWSEITINLSPYAGETVYIGFRHHNIVSKYDFQLYLDDVEVVKINDTVLTVSIDSCDFGVVGVGHSSAPKKVSYSTYNISESVAVQTVSPFEVSLDKTIFTNEISLDRAEGCFYIRYSPVDTGFAPAFVAVSASGVEDVLIYVNGEGAACEDVISQLPYSKDFNTDPPLCWDLIATNDVTWHSNYIINGYTWASCLGSSDDKIEQYETPVFDFSQHQNMVMTFDFQSNEYYLNNNYVDFKIYASTDGGITYNQTPIWKLSDYGSFDSWTTTSAAVNLRQLGGQSSVRFKFSYEGKVCQVLFGNLQIKEIPLSPERIVYVKKDAVGNQDGASWENAMVDLQNAIDYVSVLDSVNIWVSEGIYFGDTASSSRAFVIQNGVNVYGGFAGNETAGYDLSQRDFQTNTTILDGQLSRRVLDISPSSTIFDGFTVQNGMSNDKGGGINVGKGVTINNCVIKNNNSSYRGGGLYCDNAYITNCEIRGNNSQYYGGGCCGSGTMFSNCIFTHNTSYYGGGIYLQYENSNTLSNCLVTNNTATYYGGGIYCNGEVLIQNSTIARNRTTYNGAGLYNSSSNQVTLTNSILWGNLTEDTLDNVIGNIRSYCCATNEERNDYRHIMIEDLSGDSPCFVRPSDSAGASDNTLDVDWNLTQWSPCVNRGDNSYVLTSTDLNGSPRIQADTVDIGCFESCCNNTRPYPFEGVVYVTPEGAGTKTGDSWDNAMSSLQDAIMEAQFRGGVVWVASGVYYGDTTAENAFTITEGVNVYGGFYGNETPSFDLSQRDFESNETILDGDSSRRVIYQPENFNLETTWDGFTVRNGVISNYGGGAYLRKKGKLSHCVVKNNTSSYSSGGGLYVDGADIFDCLIKDNTASDGGGAVIYSGSIRNCMISSNSATYNGGGLSLYDAVADHCIISHNLAETRNYWNPSSSGRGGGVNMTGTSSLINCLVTNNSVLGAGRGGGIYGNGSIYSTTIVRNSSGYGAAAVEGNGSLIMSNSVIWGHASSYPVSNVICSYCAIQGGYEGEHNVPLLDNQNLFTPKFIHPSLTVGASDTTENVDWHLQSGSICVNMGDNEMISDSLDLSGQMRIQHGTVDLGCYESEFLPINVPMYDGVVYVTPTGAGNQSGDSWANAISSIRDAQVIAGAYNASVWVAAGTYYGDTATAYSTSTSYAFAMRDGVNVYGGFVGNEPADYDLSMRDLETNKSVLDGQNTRGILQSSSFTHHTIWDGFNFRNGNNYSSFVLLYGNAELNNCEISNNSGSISFSNATISKCKITNNSNFNLYLAESGVFNSLISNNTTSSGYCMLGYGRIVNSTIVRNIISYNTLASIFYNNPNNNPLTFFNCIVWGNQYGNITYGGSTEDNVLYSHCVVENMYLETDTTFFNSHSQELIGFVNPSLLAGAEDSTTNVDWHLHVGSLCINRGNNFAVTDSLDLDGTARVKLDTVDLGCYESEYYSSPFLEYDGVVYVTEEGAGNKSGNSWANATSSIADAQEIASLLNADVWVAEGVYYGDTSSENAFTMVEGVNVYGGFAGNEHVDYDLSQRNFEIHETILDGDSSRRVLNRVILNYAETNVETRWDGFTIRNGSASYGGGARLERNTVLSHCKVVNNQAAGEGGGIYCSRSTISECTVLGNASTGSWSEGGGIYAYSSQIHDCVISDNSSNWYGGGVGIDTSLVTDCTIRNNTAGRGGGGVAAYYGSEVRQCAILENSTTISGSSNYGGGGVFSSDSYIIDCEVRNNNSAYDGGGIYATNSQINVCDIRNNSASTLGGGVCASSSNVSRCTISRNTSKAGGGVYVKETSNITNCLISNNEVNNNYSYSYGSYGYGSGVYGYNGGSISNSTIVNNLSDYYGAGVNGGVSLLNCIIWGNKNNNTTGTNLNGVSSAQYCAVESGYAGVGNVVLNEVNPPMFLNPSLTSGASDSTEFEDWHLRIGSPCINVGNNMVVMDSLDLDGSARIKCDTVDLGCYESNFYSGEVAEYDSIIYVTVSGSGDHSGNSWENAKSSINEAQALAQVFNAVVWVAAGTYYGDTTSTNAFTMRDGVSVYGGFAGNEPANFDLSSRDFVANATILDGKNARRVLFQQYSFANKTIWDGFTIQNGYIMNGSGGGAFLRGNVALEHCIVTKNYSYFSGGGVMANGGSHFTISNCLISCNTARYTGGIVIDDGVIENSTIVRNMSTNSSAGIKAGNTYSTPILTNSIVWGNQTSDGTPSNISGSITCSYSAIEGGHEGDSIVTLSAENLPLFVNPSLTAGADDVTANVNWHLRQNSPCINAGDNSAVTDSLDLDGNPRVQDGRVDLGCYEWDNTIVIDTVWCELLLEIGRQYPDWNTDNTPWFELYQGSDEYPIYAYDYMTGTAGTKTEIIPVLSGVPFRIVWYEIDTVNRNTWCSIYSPSGDIIFEKQRFAYLENGEVLNYTSYCDNLENGGHVYVTTTGTGSGSSWADALSSIKTATIKALNTQADVWVATGTYYGDTNPTSENAFVMLDGVNVYGGFAGNEPADFDLSQRDFKTNKTVLDGQNTRRVLYASAHYTETVWDGFTIQHGRGYSGSGVALFSKAKISHCKILNNYSISGGGGGVYADHGSVSNCLIANNTASWGSGLAALYSPVINTTVVHNSGNAGVSCTQATLVNSIVWGNLTSDGAPSNLSGTFTCSYSAVEGGCEGDSIITLSAENPPLFVNPSLTIGADDTTANVDWHLQQNSPCINMGDNSAVTDSLDLDGTARIKRDTVDVGCYESDYYSVPLTEYDSIIYVTVTGAGTHSGNSWENAMSSIDSAQTLAETHNAVVWVAAGTYYGDTTAAAANAFTMVEGVNVYGGFAGNEPAGYDLSLRDFEANATELDGMNARRVLYQPSNFNTQTEWCGFSIRNGYTTDNGGGAYLQNNGVLRQCKVNSCNAGGGGGVYSSKGTVLECEISDCTAGNGGGVNCTDNTTVSSCTIINNDATGNGGGFYSYNSIIVDCDIIGNEASGDGGGVYCSYYTGIFNFNVQPTKMIRCRIRGNHSSNCGGGVCLGYENDEVNSCLVSNNSSNSTGGGLYGKGHINNVTIVRNYSTGEGGGLNAGSYNSYSQSVMTLSNCVVWGNDSEGEANNIKGNSNVFTCSHSAVEGGYSGIGNIVLDEISQPFFVNPTVTAGSDDSTANADWHLLPGSVCINRGDNSSVTDSLDLDGTARIKRDTVDLGCYESDYYSTPMVEYDNIVYVTVTGAGTRSGNSWENATPSIADAQALAKTYNAVVWVAAGTYYGDTTAILGNAFTMVDGVNVYGGFAGDETADYDLSLRDFETSASVLDGQDLRRVLFQPDGFETRTTWDGFILRHGRTTGNGGGAYLQNNGVLNQCEVTACMAGGGGGVYCTAGTLSECVISDCMAGNGGGVNCTDNTVVMFSTITGNDANGYGGGLYSYNSTIVDCEITENEASGYGGGVYCSYNSGVINFNVLPTKMIRCRIVGNRSSNNGGGVCMGYGNDEVNSCLVSNNSSNAMGGGVYGNGHLNNVTVVRNTSIDDGAGVGGSSSTTLQNCIVWGNRRNGVINNLNGSSVVCSHSAVEIGYPGTGMVILGNYENSPLFANPSLTAGADDSTANVDWHLMVGSPCINIGDNAAVTDSLDLDGTARIKRDTVDLGCYESDYYSMPTTDFGNIIYVTQTGAGNQSGESWANAMASIEEAQALAQTNDAVVWVAAGTYYGDTTTLNAFTMRDGVDVYGGFAGNEPAGFDLSQRNFEANATILDGQNERRVLYQPFEFNEEAIWNGFTIQNGRISGDGAGANLQRNSQLSQCKVQNNNSTNGNGGGICCRNASVESCEIVNNSCRKSGGGINAYSSTVSDCRIENNTSTNGGGGISVDASAVTNCRIVGNQSSGSGGGAWSYNTRFTHCDIIGNSANNSGGGVYSHFVTFITMMVAPTTVSQCRISNNYAGSGCGGIRTGYYNDKVLNSLVCNNTSGSSAGGITGFGKVVNTTIVRNLSGGNGAGVEGGVNLKNCIVWGNKNSTGAANNIVGKEIICSYSAVGGGFIGEGNFTLAEENSGAYNSPYFVNPTIGTGEAYDNGDWHLLPQSVCLNMGSLDTTILSDIDLDGQPRLQQNRVDMGCYEFQAATDGTVNISVVSGNIMRGGAVGSGYYNLGDTVRLIAVPNLYARFLRWSDNDTTNPSVVIASVDTTFTAFFELDLPELHVTSISHSELIRGDSATVSWTVQNDGTVPTPDGAVWYDRVWLSPEPKVDAEIESGSLILLGTSPNVSALIPGQSYTQTMEVNIPLQIFGNYYLFVITDAYDADQIFWENGVEIPYDPPTYYGALSHNCYGLNCVNDAGNIILEISEYDNNPLYPYYHDNFFYDSSEVHLPQFPDLKVTSVFPIMQNFFSGSAVNLTYQVTNDGDYVTWVSEWRDMIFVSNSPEFDSDAELLQIVPHHGLLLPDSSYMVSTDVTVPLDVYGTAYFYVHTDYYDQVYEHINNYNNITRSDSVNIFLTLPADLVPQNITADNVVSTGATFNFSYEIHNQGAGAPNHDSWEDKCYLSTNANTLENAVQIASDQHFSGLEAGESYAVQHSILLPDGLTTGTYYLFVNADAENNVFEYTSEENNLARFAQPISVVQPDLQIVSLKVDDTLHAGAEVAYTYQLANAGTGAVINRTVTDSLYLTQAPDGTAATRIGELSYNLWLNVQDTTLKMKNVLLPDDLHSGVYFLFVKTNESRTVNESDYNNNMSPIKRVYIHYQPLPDLVVTDIELPDTVTAGDSVTMRIHLYNQGEVPANVGNLDWRLFATKGGHHYDCVVGSGGADTTVLPPGGSVYLLKNVVISPIVFGNPVSFTLVVNPNHALTESIYSNNSHTFSHLVQPYPFDLAADQLTTLNETISGEYIPVTWNVENVGTMPVGSQPMYMRQDTTYVHSLGILQIPWYDRVYLSTDSLFDAGDVQIGSYTRNQTLNAGDSYTANLSCRIPVAADGDYHVLVVSDATNVTFDHHRANNVSGQPISVTQSVLPDLQMDTLSTISTLTTGDSYRVSYAVSNIGEHVTHDDRWTDAVYLNNQPTLVDAVLIGSKTHYGLLDVSESYSDSLSVTIPNTWTGNCYLIGVTDATGQIVESNDETNNMFSLPVSIARPLPCDLTVIPPDIPQSAMVGEDVQISWTLQNIGLNTAQGNIKDAVYLSIDNTWSSDDIMLGSETFAVNLAADGQQQRNATLFLQGVPAGDYYVVVRTNILNALNENSYDNNNAVSLLKIHLDYPSLYIGQEEHSQLNSGQSIYYKLEVGPEYEHQTLSCKLTAPSPYVSNDLYIAYSSAPSASNSDWSATVPYTQEQEILIPSLEQGIYYIMVHGQTVDEVSQSVTLLASIINFEIISVHVNSGANVGSVTTQIIGAKFDTIMDFRLANSNAYLPAEKIFFHNSTEAYATFNLRDQEPGVYDMEAELPGGIITVKGQAFMVEPGLPAELQAHIIAPAGVPNGTKLTITIEYGNNGSTDLDISGFMLVSTNGYPIAFCSDSLANHSTVLTFETAEPDGNPDVIRPGHFATKTIFVWANHLGNIELKLYPIRRQY